MDERTAVWNLSLIHIYTLMQNSTLFRRAAALLLTAALALTLVLPGLAAYEMPIQTVNEGESVLSLIHI